MKILGLSVTSWFIVIVAILAFLMWYGWGEGENWPTRR